MEGPISFWGYKEQESNLILPEHDDDDDDDDIFIWEQTATCATYSINWLVFITEMKRPISFWGYKEQESNLILPEHDDDDDDDE